MSEKGYMVRIKLITRFVISATVPAHWGKTARIMSSSLNWTYGKSTWLLKDADICSFLSTASENHY